METQTIESKPIPLTTEEDFRANMPKNVMDNLPSNFFQQLNSEPKGQVVLFPDLNKLFNTILLSTPKTPEQQKQQVEKMTSDGMKLWAVKFPFSNEGGGVLSYLTKHDLPYRGVPHVTAVERLGYVKRIIPVMIKSLPIKMMVVYYGVLFIFNRKRLVEKVEGLLSNFLDFAYNSLSIFKLDEIRYCRYVQEIRRVMGVMIAKKELEHIEKEMANQFRDVLSIVVEYDNAYRYRSQDFWQIANMDILANGSMWELLVEINRIFEEIKKRENVRVEKVGNWQKKKLMILFILTIKKYRDLFQEFCRLVNVDKLLFTPEDRDFTKGRLDYMFEGKLLYKMVPLWQSYLKKYEERIKTAKNKKELKFCRENYEALKKHLEMYADK